MSNCNEGCRSVCQSPYEVSIPNRDFGQLQFKKCLTLQFRNIIGFQSLIGILGNCNSEEIADLNDPVKFQSLIGILGNCNSHTQKDIMANNCVSIPNRDFGQLQYKVCAHLAEDIHVSIPNRDFGQLQSVRAVFGVQIVFMFQSLIGILGNCNSSIWEFLVHLHSFNP